MHSEILLVDFFLNATRKLVYKIEEPHVEDRAVNGLGGS